MPPEDPAPTSRFRDALFRDGMFAEGDRVEEAPSIGKYRLVGELGRGGMGIVYRGRDTELRRDVAIKVLRVHDRHDPEMVKRILREARTVAPLDHPGIVGVYETGEADGAPYYVMPLIEGPTLQQELHAKGLPPMRERARIVRDVSEAVAHAHARHVIHRDLKPANILLDREGRIHVLDFGLAKNLLDATQLTAAGQVFGTVAYMPPEQIDGLHHAVGTASDVYSLGAVLYEMLTGRPPVSGESFTEVVSRSLSREPEPPRRVDPKVPLDLETICLKALRKEASQRYPSAREMADDLDRWLRGEAILARPESLTEKAWRTVRRHRMATIAAGFAVLAFVVAGAEQIRESRRAAEQARVERQFLQFLREISLTDLRVTLDLRRQGVTGDAPNQLLDRLERAARETALRAPSLAEPHYHLGRMYRALQRFPEALAEQDAALAKEPGFVPSLYERAILRVLFHRQRLAELREEWDRRQGRELAESLAQPGLGKRDLPRRPTDEELVRGDTMAQEQITGIQADLRRLEKEASGKALSEARRLGVTSAMSECARGLALLYGADPAMGRTQLEEALRTDPQLEEAYEGLADREVSQGSWDAAIAVYSKGTDSDRGYVPFWIGQGRALLARGQQALSEGQDPVAWYEKSLLSFTRAAELAPEWVEAWIGRGRAHAAWGDRIGDTGGDPSEHLERAVQDLDRAVSLAPSSSEAHLARGATLAVLGAHRADRGKDPRPLYQKAVEDYDAAVSAHPTAEAYEGRADLHRYQALELKSRGEDPTAGFQGALEDYQRALELDVRAVSALRRRAAVRIALAIYRKTFGEDPSAAFPQSLADLDRAVELTAEDAGLWLDRGMLHMTWGQVLAPLGDDPSEHYRAAEECFARTTALNGAWSAAWEQRGGLECCWADWELGQGRSAREHVERAERHLTRALELYPDSFTILIALGSAQVLGGRDQEGRGGDSGPCYAKAVDTLTRSLAQNPRSPDAWMGRGEAHRRWATHLAKQGADAGAHFDSAVEDLGKALAIDATWDEVWQARGFVHLDRARAASGDVEAELRAAEGDFTEALRLNPGEVDSWVSRGQARLLLAERHSGKADAADLHASGVTDLGRATSLAPRRSDARTLLEKTR